MLTDFGLLFGLYAAALAAGSVLPGQSEAVLVALMVASDLPPWLLVLVATIGNVTGSVFNWLIGRGVERYRERRWFPATPAQLERARDWYGRYGRWALLLSWVPIVGDPLTVIAGVLRERLSIFLLLVIPAKAGRYIAIALVASYWT